MLVRSGYTNRIATVTVTTLSSTAISMTEYNNIYHDNYWHSKRGTMMKNCCGSVKQFTSTCILQMAQTSEVLEWK